MSVFSEKRAEIADALTAAGIRTFKTLPDKFTPPAAFVGPGDPYISREGMVFGGEIVRHAVTLVVASGVNEVRADELDDLAAKALDALYALADFDIGDVERPGQISVNNQPHLATSIDVTTQIHRE